MFGGGEIWMLRTLHGLAQRGHSVALLCRPGTDLGKRARRSGIRTFQFSVRGDFGPLTVLRTARLLRQEKIQIALTNMDKEFRFVTLAAQLIQSCAVIPRRGVDYPLKNQLHYRLTYEKWASKIVANSRATKQALLRNAPWLPADQIQVIYNGIDPEPFLTMEKFNGHLGFGRSCGVRSIGFVGQLDERKGIDTLLQAFRLTAQSFSDVDLWLAGEGPLRPYIEKFSNDHQLKDRIHLLGYIENVPDFMKSIDLLALPSLWEGFGIVLIEAMAAGKPVVTTNTSSMPEIVLDRITGCIVPVNDVGALDHAFQEILNDADLAKIWGENGRNRVMEQFTIDHMLDQFEDLFAATWNEYCEKRTGRE